MSTLTPWSVRRAARRRQTIEAVAILLGVAGLAHGVAEPKPPVRRMLQPTKDELRATIASLPE